MELEKSLSNDTYEVARSCECGSKPCDGGGCSPNSGSGDAQNKKHHQEGLKAPNTCS